uniref:Transposase Tc1-like domain-containing protein n=1 Tax=Anguilla anguilla TaxID=7936 RepID=A0A0E9PT14_ANGAN
MLTGEDQEDQATEDEYIVLSSKRSRYKTIPQLPEELDATTEKPVPMTTVKWQLRSAGLKGCVPVKKPLLCAVNKKKRFLWAKGPPTLDQRFWEKAV